MRSLSEHDVVRIWEAGEHRHPVDRALLMLHVAFPEADWNELVGWTVGQRNRRLLALRQRMLGVGLECFTRCPRCGESLEFTARTDQLLEPEPEHTRQQLELDGLIVHCRQPTSRDLAAVVSLGDAAAGRRLLVERCVERIERQTEMVSDGPPAPSAPVAAALPPATLLQLAEAIHRQDPLADIRFDMGCGICEHEWQASFDILAYFWSELAELAQRLLREVHLLARAYGWREADILALSPRRRHTYLELVGG